MSLIRIGEANHKRGVARAADVRAGQRLKIRLARENLALRNCDVCVPVLGDDFQPMRNPPARVFRKRVPRPDLVIDGGELPPSPPSTIVDLTNPSSPQILRFGAITKDQLGHWFSQWQKK